MDKKNTVIGVLLLLAAGVSFYFSAKYAPPPPVRPPAAAPATSGSTTARNEAPPPGPATTPSDATLRAGPKDEHPANFTTLANEFIAVKFTDHGGAIDSIALKKHLAVLGQPGLYTLNQPQAAPALSFADFPGADRDARYELVSSNAAEIVYRAIVAGRLEITRRYTLLGGTAGDPYQIRHESTFRNLGTQPLILPRGSVNIGTAAPINEQDFGTYLNVGYHDGKDTSFLRRSELEGGGFLSNFGVGSKTDLPFIEKPVAVTWASVKNQFFAAFLTLDQPGTAIRLERVKTSPRAPVEDRRAYGVTGYALFDLKPLAAGATVTWGATYYAGPKEYHRLANTDFFKHNEDLVMEFGFFGFFAKMLLTMMTWVHGWMGSVSPGWAWGWAIVLTTLILKIVFVPFTLAASRSAKRMQKLMPLVTALREKHKDEPAKAQEAMMKLYKEHKVNPLGGCIPILITIPFFIGFFSMLQSAAELRFAPFLWAHDLSAPDTVAYLLGLPLNIMPVLMGATTIIQMRLTPTPTTDNAQATMMKLMPWIFMFICYNFACALALYSFVNGVFTIGQQIIINRLPEPVLATLPAADGLKNVTPAKKKK